MFTTTRKIALAVAFAAMSLGVQAALTTLRFDDPLSTPKPLGDLSGLRFTGATAYLGSMRNTQLGGEPTMPDDGGMVMNRAAYGGGNSPGTVTNLGISLIEKNAYFTSLVFDYAISGTIAYVLRSGGNDPKLGTLTGGSPQMNWVRSQNWLAGITDGSRVDSIEFVNAGSDLFALDNLQFDIGTTGTTPTVPEPTSYALVALALLAAGGASRRRKA